MKKKTICALAAGMMLCLAGCGAAKEQPQDIPVTDVAEEQEQTQEQSEAAEATPEPFRYELEIPQEKKLLENLELLEDMSVTIEGRTIAVPCKYSDLMEAGFFLADYFGSETTEEEYIKNDPGLDEDGMTFNLHNLNIRYRLADGTELQPYTCGYVEPQGELVSFRELDYTSFIFENIYTMGSGLFCDLSVGNSLAQVFFGEDYKQVLEDYGDPTTVWIQDGTGFAELAYYTGEDGEGTSYSLSVGLMNGKVERISYQRY